MKSSMTMSCPSSCSETNIVHSAANDPPTGSDPELDRKWAHCRLFVVRDHLRRCTRPKTKTKSKKLFICLTNWSRSGQENIWPGSCWRQLLKYFPVLTENQNVYFGKKAGPNVFYTYSAFFDADPAFSTETSRFPRRSRVFRIPRVHAFNKTGQVSQGFQRTREHEVWIKQWSRYIIFN